VEVLKSEQTPVSKNKKKKQKKKQQQKSEQKMESEYFFDVTDTGT
jgi:hypothetical protein